MYNNSEINEIESKFPNLRDPISVETYYENIPEKHVYVWNNMKYLVNSHRLLKSHRDFVVDNGWGYGNRAFHWMWNILVRSAPQNFKFLEIGVFKGQTISLVSLLNKLYNKEGHVFGITPLSKSGDKYATHPDIDYETAILTIYAQFELDADDLQILQGYSNDVKIINKSKQLGPYDLIYVDGCHDYEVVVSDLTNYGDMVKLGGYLIVDDASNNLNIPDNLIRLNWRGLPDVSKATDDTLTNNPKFKEAFAVGHIRVFRRIAQ
jgi:hypothetical protein